jgi:Domain of unknown function (DUF4397)
MKWPYRRAIYSKQKGEEMKSNKVCLLFLAIIGFSMMACSREAESTDRVTTTTDKGAWVAPSAKEAEKEDKALVRVINALPDVKALDTFVGNSREFANVSYKTVTPYKAVPDVLEQISIRPAGEKTGQPFAQNKELINGGNYYTAIAMPESDNKATLRVVSDELEPPPASKAKLRVIHASPNVGEIDVFMKGNDNALFSGVNPQTATGFNEIDPTMATLEIRTEGKKDVLLIVPDMKFESGHNYTIVITGKPNDTPKLEAIKIDDRLNVAAATPRVSPSPTATAMNK